jgi:FAD/FMN-containing dehydrogenase
LSAATDVHSLLTLARHPQTGMEVVPGVFSGLWLPTVQLSAFMTGLKKVEEELSVELPMFIDTTRGYVDVLPVFDLKKVTDRQKMLRTLSAVADLAQKHGGSLTGYGGEGRLKSLVTYATLNEAEAALYQQIKNIFDPHGILNPDVKQKVAAKDIASQLNAWCRDAA